MASIVDLLLENQTLCMGADLEDNSTWKMECSYCIEQLALGNDTLETPSWEFLEGTNCSFCREQLIGDCAGFIAAMNRQRTMTMIPVIIFMMVMMLVGLCGNSVVIVVHYYRSQKTTDNMFMAALASIDFLSCLLLHPYVISKFFYFYDPGVVTCKVFEFLIHVSLSVQSLTLMGVAIKRHFSITRPLQSMKISSYSVYFIPLAVVVGTVVSVPITVFYGGKTVWFGPVKTYVCHYSDYFDGSSHQTLYSFWMFLTMAAILTVLITLYSHIACMISRRRRQVGPEMDADFKKQTTSSLRSTGDGRDSQEAGNSAMAQLQLPSKKGKVQANEEDIAGKALAEGGLGSLNVVFVGVQTVPQTNQEPALKPEDMPSTSKGGNHDSGDMNRVPSTGAPPKTATGIRGSKILFIVTAVFFISWIPFWVLRIRGAFYHSDWGSEDEALGLLQSFLNHLFYINNAVNPIIYVFINSKFIEECKMTKKKVFSNIRFKCC